MSLTVPTAGTNPGRAASIQVEPDRTGDIIAQAGQVALNVGTRLEADRLSREAQRTQVNLTRDLNNLRLEMQQIGDPDELDRTWAARTTALRQQYLEGTDEEGRPRVDPRNRERIGLAFDDLSNRHALAIGAQSLEARRSQRNADWLAYEHEAGNMAALSPDPGTRDVLTAQGDQMIAAMVADGTITPEEGQKRRMALRGGMANQAAIEQVAADPAGFLQAAEAGAYNDLGAETVARYSVQAQNAIDSAAAASAREAEAAAKARNSEIGDRLKEYRDIYAADRTPIDEAFMALPDVQAHEDYAKTRAALDLSRERADLPFYTPDQLREAIAEERARPLSASYQTERLELLEDQLAIAEEGWGKDAVAHAKSIGLPITPLPDFDPSDPQPFMDALGRRQTEAQALVQQGYIDAPRALDENERAAINAAAAATNDPRARVALARAVIPTLRGVGADNASEFIDDRVFLHIGNQLAQGNMTDAVAAEAFRGQQVQAEGNVIMPPIRERTDAAFATVQNLFGNVQGGEAIQSTVIETADAIYAARVRQSDPAGDIDEDVYRQALHEAMGGSGNYDGRQARGGIQIVRDVPTALPAGINGRNVDDVLDALTADVSPSQLPPELRINTNDDARFRAGQTPEARAFIANKHLTAASLTGAGPSYQGQDLIDILNAADIQAVANDRFVFVYRTQQGPRVLYDAQGRELQFSLRALMREVGR